MKARIRPLAQSSTTFLKWNQKRANDHDRDTRCIRPDGPQFSSARPRMEEPLDPILRSREATGAQAGLNACLGHALTMKPAGSGYYFYEYEAGARVHALPGGYQVRLTSCGKTQTAPSNCAGPRVKVSARTAAAFDLRYKSASK